ncbi:MAG TPA: threonine synthase [Aggregatilineales bacterium]|nr:threonine synthase [Aggregatilineales bacterium]
MPATYITSTRCTHCGATYALEQVTYTCPVCGPAGTLDMVYDYEAIAAVVAPASISAKRDFSMWRYRPVLPILEDAFIPPLPVGWTPLMAVPRLAARVGLQDLWVKDEGRNPTASLKDRASAMAVARAMQLDVPVVTTASTGNAAAALAGLCASVGKKAVIFVPATAPPAKVAQLLVYGATVFLVNGSYDEAFELCVQTADEYGWYCRNTGMNPYTTEGKKTAAFEIVEQLDWQVPDVVVVSVGDGSIIGGLYKGFYDMRQLGWISRLPRLVGVQAEASANLARAWERGDDPAAMIPGPADTIADSISAGFPRDRVKAIRAVRETGGLYVSVPDSAILASIPELAQFTGVFAEPAAAATLAGLYEARRRGAISPTERIVLLVTGNGLKDVAKAMQSVGTGIAVEASMSDVRRAVAPLAL